MSDEKRITVSRTIPAPVERVFALLADPDRHPDLDSTGTVRHSRSHFVITGVGEVFSVDMHDQRLGGDYLIDNLVTTYVRDEAIGWAPGLSGKDPIGHTFTYTLIPESDDRTAVTQTYDWSGVTRELPIALPVVSREQLERSLQLLADAL